MSIKINGKANANAAAMSQLKKLNQSRQNAMTPEYIAKIEAYAQRDAQAGVYMSPGYIAMEKAYVAANISPDRAGAIAKATAEMNRPGPKEESFDWFCEMLNIPYEGKIQRSGILGPYVQLYDENGEMIAAYNSASGWTTVPTSAEESFWQTANQIYYAAHTAAKAAIQQTAALAGQTISLAI